MKRYFLICSAAFGLSACNTVPDQPDFTISLEGNYKKIADCAYLTFRDLDSWQMTDLSSMNRVEFAFRNDASTAGRINVEAEGPGRTRVTSYMQAAVWGKDFWAKRYRPIFEACAV